MYPKKFEHLLEEFNNNCKSWLYSLYTDIQTRFLFFYTAQDGEEVTSQENLSVFFIEDEKITGKSIKSKKLKIKSIHEFEPSKEKTEKIHIPLKVRFCSLQVLFSTACRLDRGERDMDFQYLKNDEITGKGKSWFCGRHIFLNNFSIKCVLPEQDRLKRFKLYRER